MLLKIIHESFFALWFFLPAGIANMMPIFAARWPIIKNWEFPMDFGLTFRGKRVFGAHKTIRGLVVGIVFATLTLWLQQLAFEHSGLVQSWVTHVDYSTLPILILGPLFAIGALLGDAIESFFKRQLNIAPGDGWFPFDQIDYIVGGAIASAPFVALSFKQYILLIFIWFCLHVISTVVGYLIGVKDKPI
jgi:CDP-2,3-bis-(O-geranylgeranyl)-sn-glycerol synthase